MDDLELEFDDNIPEAEEAVEVKPKPEKIAPKPAVRVHRPRNILRTDHLISARGIAALPDIFSETKFKGKGHELDDLKLLLFKTKHWAHRLFPGLTFEDFVTKTEQLGHKKVVKNFLSRIRRGQSTVPECDLDNDDNGSDGEELPVADLPGIPVEKPTTAEAAFDALFKDQQQPATSKIPENNDDDVFDDDEDLLLMLTEKKNDQMTTPSI